MFKNIRHNCEHIKFMIKMQQYSDKMKLNKLQTWKISSSKKIKFDRGMAIKTLCYFLIICLLIQTFLKVLFIFVLQFT